MIRVATGRLMLTSLTCDAQHVLDEMDVLAPLAVKTHDPLVHSSFLNVYSALLVLGGPIRRCPRVGPARDRSGVAVWVGIRNASCAVSRALALHGLRSFQECRATLSTCERTPFVREHNFLRMNLGHTTRSAFRQQGVAKAIKPFERHEPAFKAAMPKPNTSRGRH